MPVPTPGSSPLWLAFGLLCAFFYASHGAQTKRLLREVDNVVLVWASSTFALPVTLGYSLVEGFAAPTAAFGWALAGVVAINAAANLMYNHAIHLSDLSLVIPLLAFTPVWMLATSRWMLGETAGLAGTAGILLICAGTLALRPDPAGGWLGPIRALARDPGARVMMGVALLWSLTANLDKIGVTEASATTYMTAFQAAFCLLFLPAVNTPGRRLQIRRHWRGLAVLGLLAAGMWIAQYCALRMTLAPYVIAMKRSGLLISIAYGHYLFQEKGIRERITGGMAMAAGLFLLAVAATEE